MRYVPAGLSAGIAPAGEMWSVVTESPSIASTRAPLTPVKGLGCGANPSKYGGSFTYVESGSHWKIGPVGADIFFQCSSPSKMREYSRLNMSCCTHLWTTSLTSAGDGHSSDSITGLPSRVVPTGSLVRSMWTAPASPYATTSGGEPGELPLPGRCS